MSYIPVLDLIDEMMRETSRLGNHAAMAVPGQFEASGMASGLAVRLKTMADVKSAVLTMGIRQREEGVR